MFGKRYSKAPIVEAVVEFRFAKEIDFPDLQSPSRRPHKEYTNAQQTVRLGGRFTIGEAQPQAEFEQQPMGWEFRTAAGDVVLIVDREKVLFSQLAPYPGWEVFRSRVQRDWEWARKTIGIHPIGRVAIRTINRIDVPSQMYQPVQYLTTLPTVPPSLGVSLDAFTIQVELAVSEDAKRRVRINAGSISEMVVPNHGSLLLDIDLWDDEGQPMRLESAWAQLEELRNLKNHIFEQCITDAARELFQ